MGHVQMPGRAVTAAVVLLGGLHATRYLGHFSDDAFIALRYADRLARGRGLTHDDGEWVEGYSDLLWVLLLGAGRFLGLDGVLVARALGLFGFGLALWVVSRGGPRRALSGGLLLALSGGLAAWSVGGLEHALLAGVVALTAHGCRENRRWAPWLGPVLALLRLDGVVLAVLLGGAYRNGRLVGLAAIAFVLQGLFRLWAYGTLVPHTAAVKVSLGAARAWQGVQWVVEALAWNGVLVVAALLAAVVCARSRPLVAVAVGWCGFVALEGGDIFYGFRALLPVFPLFALAVSDGAESLNLRYGWLAGLAHGAVQLFSVPVTTLAQPGWALSARVPAEQLGRVWRSEDPLLAVDAAGVLPTATGFRTLDMLGLVDGGFLERRPAGFGDGDRIGHDLGDGPLVASHRPDLVVFCSALGSHTPCFESGRQWVGLADWGAYRPVFVQTQAGLARWYVRVDGVLGVVDGSLAAWLLSTEQHPATLDGQGLRLELPAGAVFELPAGLGTVTEGFSHGGQGTVATQAVTLRWLPVQGTMKLPPTP